MIEIQDIFNQYGDECGHVRVSYNSCRNRHCPKCQTLAKERWLEKRKEDLLTVGYFHVVFTIPEELNYITLTNQKEMYSNLFKSVSETLLELSSYKKYLGAEIGFMAILHTCYSHFFIIPILMHVDVNNMKICLAMRLFYL